MELYQFITYQFQNNQASINKVIGVIFLSFSFPIKIFVSSKNPNYQFLEFKDVNKYFS